MNESQPRRFENLADYLIWRATGSLGDFKMPVLTRIIETDRNERRDNFARQITTEDIQRILAHYKKHVGYWNISMDLIQSELKAFADALGYPHNYFEIATLFDASL